jgi:hypothetical protein
MRWFTPSGGVRVDDATSDDQVAPWLGKEKEESFTWAQGQGITP